MKFLITRTIYGKVKGINNGSHILFKGIPYAKPPIGELRFKRPIKVDCWDGIFPAESFSPRAIQPENPNAKVNEPISEDCLTLNIATPGISGNYPVVVYIHGGGSIRGSGADEFNKALSFVKNDDILFVSINYRLGILGFLYLGHLLGKEYENSANCAILDIIESLKWIKENIAFFGGNPNNVTIMGESAGAKCIGAVLIAAEAKGLFHKAILCSGSIQCIRDKYTAQKNTDKIIKTLGISKNEAGKLIDIPVEKLLEAQNRISPGIHFFGPVIDGITITKTPMEIIKGGRANKVKIIIGTNKDEINWLLMNNDKLKRKDKEIINSMFGINSDIIWKVYKAEATKKSKDEVWKEILTDYVYRMASVRLGDALAEVGWEVWMYSFDFQTSMGAFHGINMDFIWNDINSLEKFLKIKGICFSKMYADQLALKMHESWAEFIKFGNPKSSSLPEWEKYSTDKKHIMSFDKVSKIENITNLRSDRDFPDQVLIYTK